MSPCQGKLVSGTCGLLPVSSILTGRLLDARLLGRAAGIGFTQKLKRKANEDEIPRRKKQLGRRLSQCLKEQIEAGKSRNRGRWSDLYLSGGWAIS